MKLTPLEIRKQEFRKTLRGFDPIEVQTFLEMVSEQYEELLEENKSLNRRLIELETKLHDYQENERNLRETLLNVQEVKKQSEESSRRQADLITKEAELKALEILENARKQTRQIREEVNWLKSQKESFINRLRHILVSQIELLSVMEIDDVLPDETKEILKNLKVRKHPGPGRTGSPAEAENLAETGDLQPDESAAETESGEDAGQEENAAGSGGNHTQNDRRVIRQMSDPEEEETHRQKKDKKGKDEESSLTDDDINDFFKKGIQIDDLIKTIHKKDSDK